MKIHTIATIAFASITLAACGKTDDYSQRLQAVADSISVHTVLAITVSDQFERDWARAIDESRDFNDALADTRTRVVGAGVMDMMKEGRARIDSMMKTVSEPPEERRDAYAKVLEYYGNYSQLYDLGTSPSGSLLSYRQQTSEIGGKQLQLVNQLKAMGVAGTHSDTTQVGSK